MREGPQGILNGDVELCCNTCAIQCPLKERHVASMLAFGLLHYPSCLLILATCMCLGDVVSTVIFSLGRLPEPKITISVRPKRCEAAGQDSTAHDLLDTSPLHGRGIVEHVFGFAC